MALIIKIQVNHKILTVISAQRIKDGENGNPNTYRITSMDYRSDPEGELSVHGHVEHDYNRPAEELTQKAITAVLGTPGTRE
jgi:hypothetical protein